MKALKSFLRFFLLSIPATVSTVFIVGALLSVGVLLLFHEWLTYESDPAARELADKQRWKEGLK